MDWLIEKLLESLRFLEFAVEFYREILVAEVGLEGFTGGANGGVLGLGLRQERGLASDTYSGMTKVFSRPLQNPYFCIFASGHHRKRFRYAINH